MLDQRINRHRGRLPGRLAAAMAAAALTFATPSCADASGGPGSPTPSPSSTATTATDPGSALLAFNACLRANGVAVPDDGPAVARGEGKDPNFAAAARKCKHHLAGTSIEVATGGGGGMVSEEQLKALLAYAGCMRGKGIDMPDPDPNRGAVAPEGSGIDQDSDEFRSAHAACRSHLGNAEVADGGAS